MDAEEFMMHGFDSDVSDGDDREDTMKASATDADQDSSKHQKKYK